MSDKYRCYTIMTSIFSVGFDVYDPAGQPAYYETRHTFPTIEAAENAVRQLIKQNGNKFLEEDFHYNRGNK